MEVRCISSFAPWVTHGIELHAFIARKVPKSMHLWPYIGKELHVLHQKYFPVNYKIIGYESHLHHARSRQRGTRLLLHI